MRYQEFKRNEYLYQSLLKLDEMGLESEVRDQLAYLMTVMMQNPAYDCMGIQQITKTSSPDEFMESAWTVSRTSNKSYKWKMSKHAVCVGDILDPHADDGYGNVNADWDCSQQQVILNQGRVYIYTPPTKLRVQ